jgi:hypothetical protein
MIPEILITEEAVSSPESWSVAACLVDFVNDLREKRFYEDRELPEAALHVFAVDSWLAQVNNGGVSQYVANLEMFKPEARSQLDMTERALQAMGADEFLKLYRDMRRVLANDIRPDGQPVKDGDTERIEAEFERQSNAFFDLNDYSNKNHLGATMRAYILAQPNTRLLPATAWREQLIKFGNDNPFRAERAKARKEARAAFEAQYPMYAAARQLCAQCGREFVQFNAGGAVTLDGKAANGMALATDSGTCMMILMGTEALLFRKKLPSPELERASMEEWFAYLQKHPDALEGLETYHRSEGLLATMTTPEPLWPLAQR